MIKEFLGRISKVNFPILFGVFFTLFGGSVYHLLLDITSISNNILDILFPDFIGYIFIIWGIQKFLDAIDSSRVKKSAKLAFIFSVIIWSYNLVVESINVPEFMLIISLIVSLLGLVELIYYVSTFYFIAVGLEKMHVNTSIKIYGQIAKRAWIGATICIIIAFVCTNTSPTIALILSIISTFLQIVYFVALLIYTLQWKNTPHVPVDIE